MVVQCQRPSAILNHQDFPLRTFAMERHWHQAKKLLEEASRQQLMLRFGTLITCAIARCRNHQLEHFPNSAATMWYNRTNYSGDMIPLYLLKMLDSKNDELNSPESIADLLSASDKSSVTAWTSSAGCIMLKPSHLGAVSISLLQCPFFHFFSASQNSNLSRFFFQNRPLWECANCSISCAKIQQHMAQPDKIEFHSSLLFIGWMHYVIANIAVL